MYVYSMYVCTCMHVYVQYISNRGWDGLVLSAWSAIHGPRMGVISTIIIIIVIRMSRVGWLSQQ